MPQSIQFQEVQPAARSLSDASPARSLATSISSLGGKYNFQKKIELYKGSISTVYKCLLAGGNPVVVKMYHKPKMQEKHFHKLEREIEAMRALGHGAGSSAVVQLLDTFEDTQAIYLIMECCEGGDLFKRLLLHGGKLPEAWVCVQVIAPLLRVLEHMHGLSLMHRDIKPENIFLTAEGDVKLGDFGLAMDWTKELPFSRSGTLDYMAPEVLLNPATHTQESPSVTSSQLAAKNIKPYTCAVDVWAVGCLAYELVCGRPPFEVEDEKQTASLIIYSNVIRFDPSASAAWADFVTQALIKDPRQRPAAAKLLAHPWVCGHLERAAPPVVVKVAPSAGSLRTGAAAAAVAPAVVAVAASAGQERSSNNRHDVAPADAVGERPSSRSAATAAMDARPPSAGQPTRAPAGLGGCSSVGGGSVGASSACGSAATAVSGCSSVIGIGSSSSSMASSATCLSFVGSSYSSSGSGSGGGPLAVSRPPSATASRAGASPLLVARTNPQHQVSMTPPPPVAPPTSPAPVAAGGGAGSSAYGMTASVPPQQRAPAPPAALRHATGSTFGSNPALRSLLGAFKAAALGGSGSGATTNSGSGSGNAGIAGSSGAHCHPGPPPPSRPVSAASNAPAGSASARSVAAASAAPSASCPGQPHPPPEPPGTSSGGGSSVAAVVGGWRPPPAASPMRHGCGPPPHDQVLPGGRDGLPLTPCPPSVQRAPSSATGAAAGPAGAGAGGFNSPSRMPRCAGSVAGANTGAASSNAPPPHSQPRSLHSWASGQGRANSVTGPPPILPPPPPPHPADDARPSLATLSAGYVDQLPAPQPPPHRHGSPGPLWARPASPNANACATSPLRRAHAAGSPSAAQPQLGPVPGAPAPWQLPPSSPPRREPAASPPRQGWVQPSSPTSASSASSAAAAAASLHELTRNWGAVVSVSVSKLFNGGRRSGSGSAFASPQRQAPAGGKAAQGLDSYGLPPPTPVAAAMPPAEYCTPKPVGVLERVKYHLRGGGGALPAPGHSAGAYGGQQAQAPPSQPQLPPQQAPGLHGVYVVGGAPVAAVEIL